MKRILFVICIALVSSCASEPKSVYDPTERQFPGKVLSKQVPDSGDVDARLRTIQSAKYIGTVVEVLLTGGIGIVPVPAYDSSLPGQPTLYEVQLESEKTVQLYNHYTGFNIGDCVIVFLGDNWQEYPPRMTSRGGNC